MQPHRIRNVGTETTTHVIVELLEPSPHVEEEPWGAQLPVLDARSLNELLCGAVHYRLTSGRKEPFIRRDAEWIVDVVLGGVRAAERPD